MRLLALTVTTAALASAALAAGPAQIVVTGQYTSNYDAVTLVQIGDRVTGTYKCCGGGTIEGQIDGRTLRYRWKQPGSWGLGVWQISPGRLDGTWGSNQSETSGGRWDLVLVKPVPRIAN
jgi:hypothetical protein